MWVSCRATLSVPCATVRAVLAWLSAHRRADDIRSWQRAATPRTQAVMLLCWLIGATGVAALAPGAHVSLAAACRYLHEALAVLARRAPQLPDVLGELHDQGEPFVCLDATLHRHRRPRSPHLAGQPLVVLR